MPIGKTRHLCLHDDLDRYICRLPSASTDKSPLRHPDEHLFVTNAAAPGIRVQIPNPFRHENPTTDILNGS